MTTKLPDPPFKLIPVSMIGETKSLGIVCGPGGGPAMLKSAKYPPSPRGEELRKIRVEEGRGHITAIKLAAELGFTTAQLGQLERGELTLESAAEWDRLADLVRQIKGIKNPPR